MRIAQIMLAKGFGGAERSFVDLCIALQRRGHDVLAICESRGRARSLIAEANGLTCRPIRVNGSWDFISRHAIKRELRRFAPTIAQMHLARAATLAGPATRALGIPSLAKTHNYVKLKYYEAIDHLVPTTRKQFDYLLAEGRPGTQLSLIPNFSSTATTPVRVSVAAMPLRVVAVGRFVEKKGFDLLLEALAQARASGADALLKLVGAGPESDRLSDICRALKLESAVEFLGWQNDVTPFLNASDVFVLPSRDEPFGIVCLEAMAAGLPIITSSTDGPSEILDSHTALFVPKNDAPALAAALVELARDLKGAQARAALAQRKFVKSYSEDVVVEQYLSLYKQLQKN